MHTWTWHNLPVPLPVARCLPYRVCGSDFPAKTLLLVQIKLIDLGAYLVQNIFGPKAKCPGTEMLSPVKESDLLQAVLM